MRETLEEDEVGTPQVVVELKSEEPAPVQVPSSGV
jgi:hypothetical protein